MKHVLIEQKPDSGPKQLDARDPRPKHERFRGRTHRPRRLSMVPRWCSGKGHQRRQRPAQDIQRGLYGLSNFVEVNDHEPDAHAKVLKIIDHAMGLPNAKAA
jgi:hypothetical protein